MILESEIENRIIGYLKGIGSLDNYQIVGSRQIGDIRSVVEQADTLGVIAVQSAFRVCDNFSLSTITVSFSISIVTRTENDPTAQRHEITVETIADILTDWHKHGNTMTEILSTEKVLASELRMDGGTGRIYDKQNSLWNDTINFSIRGSQIFNN